MTMVCLSFSSFAESYFVKVADNEYVLQHGEKSENLGINKSGYGAIAPVDAIYTPTHIFTYPDGDPAHFRNIQKIDYTESNVTFVKNIKTRKCYIDIYDDEKNPNKCRIIGVNGHNITGTDNNFEVYNVAEEANSFTDSKQRLIYIDHTGLYIVSEKENPIEDISKNYFLNRKFDFKGEIIKISAIDGKRKVSGFDENKKAIFAFNCPSDTPIEATPVMKQIEEITGVKLVTPPPSEKAALKRMAEILDVPEELLVIEDGEVFIVDARAATVQGGNVTKYPASLYGLLFNSYVLELKKFISPKKDLPQSVLYKAYSKIKSSTGYEGQGVQQEYKFDRSPEAQQRRKEIALKPWDKE